MLIFQRQATSVLASEQGCPFPKPRRRPKNCRSRFRRSYIRYADGSEELYDHDCDPHEWHNLADKAEHAEIIAEMRRALPKRNAEPIIGDWQNWEIEAWREAENRTANLVQ